MDAETALLVATAAGIALLHTLAGPDHYLPFIMMSRARQWPLRRSLLVTFLCGLGHVLSSVVLGAVGVAGLNSERPGGVTNMLRAIDYAEARGLASVLHNQPLGIASAMHVHVALARHHALGHATELFGHVMLEDDMIIEPIDYDDGKATVPAGPGWGVELDEDALAKYATAKTVKMESR